jgi:phage N-6-adenine-methyltransferase
MFVIGEGEVAMSINKGMMSSATDQWATPQDFFDKTSLQYGPFDIDVCAEATNAKCTVFFDKNVDGLKQKWVGKCWMNPPYGRDIAKWMEKAHESWQEGATVVCLVPARTDTKWWHHFAMKGQVVFIRGRLKFGSAKNSAPFPSALVIFKQE